MSKIQSIQEYILTKDAWSIQLMQLHELLVSVGLKGSIKWNSPVYSFNGKNLVGLGAFKKHLAVWFFQGVFLSDKHKLLLNVQENSKAFRQIRIAPNEIIDEPVLLKYILEAIENQKAGKEYKPSKKEVVIPEELNEAFKQDPSIEKDFKKFSSAKQYEFTHHIAKAKRLETRQKRVEQVIPLIQDGIGLNDKYRK